MFYNASQKMCQDECNMFTDDLEIDLFLSVYIYMRLDPFLKDLMVHNESNLH